MFVWGDGRFALECPSPGSTLVVAVMPQRGLLRLTGRRGCQGYLSSTAMEDVLAELERFGLPTATVSDKIGKISQAHYASINGG